MRPSIPRDEGGMGGVPAAPLDARRTAKAEAEAGCGSFEAAAARIGAAMEQEATLREAPGRRLARQRSDANHQMACRRVVSGYWILDTGYWILA